MNPRNGDIIYRQMIGLPMFNHYGIFVTHNGQPHVIHKSSETGPTLVTLQQFLGKYDLRGVRPTELSGWDSAAIIKRFSQAETESFNLFLRNCEKFAYELSMSDYKAVEVVKGLVIVTVAMAVIGLAALTLRSLQRK